MLVGSCGSTVQAPESGGTVLRKYTKLLTTSKSFTFAFRLKILERDYKARKRETEHGSGISPEYREIDQIMEDYLERRDEEETRKRLNSVRNQLKIETRRIKIRYQGRR
ncbi:hypothetical protein P5673_025499 [Acropora cervicornis]|uniref:Uncharacterized protein n=1 Tax=Acropora cervicornis TaxID=6130 RepID=A0AAD9UXE8_ACRCE|nr:hypothetical protein P5673_025499 [Acropora cervicornis]